VNGLEFGSYECVVSFLREASIFINLGGIGRNLGISQGSDHRSKFFVFISGLEKVETTHFGS
jgi:hypothetical protein